MLEQIKQHCVIIRADIHVYHYKFNHYTNAEHSDVLSVNKCGHDCTDTHRLRCLTTITGMITT